MLRCAERYYVTQGYQQTTLVDKELTESSGGPPCITQPSPPSVTLTLSTQSNSNTLPNFSLSLDSTPCKTQTALPCVTQTPSNKTPTTQPCVTQNLSIQSTSNTQPTRLMFMKHYAPNRCLCIKVAKSTMCN